MKRKDKRMLRRIIIAAAVFIVSLIANKIHVYAGLALLISAYVIIGYDVLLRALRGVKNLQVFDENFLMAIATVGALIIGEYHEAVFVMLFYQVGELFQSIAIGKSRRSITSLMDLRPDVARKVTDDGYADIDPCEIAIGDIIEVRPGEKIPLDGVVISGHGSVNTAALTGESLPDDKTAGDSVLSGCVNLDGILKIRVSAAFENSTVSKILELVENSTANKSKSEAFITRFARYYTPAVVIGALALAVLPPVILGITNAALWREWVYRAMTFLVISCPCALVISVPLTFFGGIGCASRHGVLVKGANYLETLSMCDTVLFDKTGTLTEGRFAVTDVCPIGIDKMQLLTLASIVESRSAHPIAQAITSHFPTDISPDDYTELAGRGVKARADGKEIHAGNVALMQSIGITPDVTTDSATAVHIACDGAYCGYILLSDAPKPDAKAAIADLKTLGITKTVMLTGDKTEVAKTVAEQLDVDEFYAELMPADKVGITERLSDGGRRIAFAGDGINDAPVLARSDVGIAMGGIGSDAAIEAADVVLMDDSPRKIVKAIRISRFTRRIVKQNVAFILLVKALTLILGALGFANMWMAVFADVGVAVIAILNAIRTIKKSL